ncbi:MAG TPA: response regulator transcription factor [Gemmatimonadaceae bacterium]
MSEELIRVILADDHAVVRAGLKAVLGASRDIEVVGEASNGAEAIALAERLDPDVVIMDLSMEPMDGTAATRQIAEKKLRARVLILTMHTEEDYLIPVLEAGASGFLMKNAADRELVDAVRTVARGDMFVRASATRILAQGIGKKDPLATERARFERLTEREQNVLKFTARGYSAPEIGERLCISPKTVDTYKQRIGDKLGLTHRAEYISFALKLGLLSE